MVQFLLDHGASADGSAVTYVTMFGNKDALKPLKNKAYVVLSLDFLG